MAVTLLSGAATLVQAQAVADHPRLLVRASDLPRLRSWAVSTNPIYARGLAALTTTAKTEMDAGLIMTAANGGPTYVSYPAEMYAELFAFMSLLSSDQTTRDDYAQRARTLLMYVINEAARGVAAGQPYRAPQFATSDRSRWQGEGFPLTVDWIYPYLTAADKSTIRQVFLRWVNENLNAATTSFNHPSPIGVLNSSALLQNRQAVRFAGNNYFSAHMRNIGLMAASFDPADDPGGALRAYIANATGAWLYVFDNLMRTDAAGGFMPEGFEYSPQTVGYAAQWLLALKTAGLDDPAVYGPQVVPANNPFWDQLLPAYLHSLSPAPSSNQDVGQVYLPAWYGDGQNYYTPDFIAAFAPLALYDQIAGNSTRPQQIRWIETNLAPGGASGLTGRARDGNFFINSILYFLLFDPAGAAPADPRPSQDTSWFAGGLGRILARTSWDPKAAWFTWKLSFNQVDHQTADGNQFEFYRNGEWLTKERTGYDLDAESSLNHNTLALQNTQVQRDPTDYRTIEWQLGSQWSYVAVGDPKIVAQSLSPNFTYVTGDATNLYNSTNENSTDILHASRSVIWLKPDYIVVYDRATSQTANRFKRFWLNVPTLPTISGRLATMTTAAGQRLFVTSLLPASSTITAEQSTVVVGDVANFEPMKYRIRVDATGGPTNARFLHVLQGADAGSAAGAATLLQSSGGTSFEGVAAPGFAVLFPVTLGSAFGGLTYTAPASSNVHRVTGLTPGAGYRVTLQPGDAGVQVSISAGGATLADAGGVLEFSTGPGAAPVITGIVNGASYTTGAFPPNSYVSLFGTNLAGSSTALADSSGNRQLVSAAFNGATQINLVIPAATAGGPATITVTTSAGISAPFPLTIGGVLPGIFTANSSGTGPAAAQALIVANNATTSLDTARCSGSPLTCTTVTIPLAAGSQVYLVLYGTGLRSGKTVTANIGGVVSTVEYAGAQGAFPGLDQINVSIPAGLAGRGDVDAVVTVDGVSANPVRVRF